MQSVTLFTRHGIGTEGYIIKRKVSDLNATSISFIQINTDTASSDPITSETAITTLHSYINDASCPDVAYSLNGDTLTIFLKDTVYPYSATTKFAIYGKRNAIANSGYVDVPSNLLELFINYCIREAAQILGRVVPSEVKLNIQSLEAEL